MDKHLAEHDQWDRGRAREYGWDYATAREFGLELTEPSWWWNLHALITRLRRTKRDQPD
jgi:hypothetical protein